jgi:hypothetical protein
MAKRYELGGSFGSHNASESGGFKWIALRGSMVLDRANSFPGHQDACGSNGVPGRRYLIARVDHPDATIVIDVGKLIHLRAIYVSNLSLRKNKDEPLLFFGLTE